MVAAGDQFTSGFQDSASNGTETSILDARIPGSHFQDVLPTASMVVAGLCFLFFFGIGIPQCIAGYRSSKNKRFRVSIGSSTFIMIVYFAMYTADRILTEIQEKRVVMYYPFLIVLETANLVGDSLLMLFLLRAFTVALFELIDMKKDNTLWLTLSLSVIAWGLNLLAMANPAAFIYYLVSNRLLSDETKQAIKNTGGARVMIVTAYREITLAFYCIYLGASLIMTWICVFTLRKLKQRRTPEKAFRVGLPLLVACLDVRSVVKLVFAGLFQYTPRGESPTAKFFHILIYGFLSIVIYGAVLWITRSGEWDKGSDATVYDDLEYAPNGAEQHSVMPYKGHEFAVGTYPVPPHAH